MSIKKISIVYFFRYLWLIIAIIVVLTVLSKAVFTKRSLVYNLDFNQSISRDITGWYPESRTVFNQSKNQLQVINEPLYLQFYVPTKFETLTVKGQLDFDQTDIKLGLKQADGAWYWQPIIDQNFSLDFLTDQAHTKSNKMELILSIPNLPATSTIGLVNNWQLILNR